MAEDGDLFKYGLVSQIKDGLMESECIVLTSYQFQYQFMSRMSS